MSEPNSLYVKIKIKEEKLGHFFQQKPIHLTIDDNWRAWWDSREMYSKQELTYIPIYRTENNRAVFDELLKDIDFGSFEQYDRHAQSWTFVSVFFSENYLEILPMLALLKNLASYQEPTEKGIAMIYDFCWGGTSTMAFLEFYEQKALLKDYTETTQIEPSILEEANQVLSATVEAFNKRFED